MKPTIDVIAIVPDGLLRDQFTLSDEAAAAIASLLGEQELTATALLSWVRQSLQGAAGDAVAVVG